MIVSNKKKYNLLIIIFLYCFLILFAGLREPGSDMDSLNYLFHFNHFQSFFQSNFLDKEPSFWLILEINKKYFFNNIHGVFFLYIFVQVSLIFYGIYKYSSSVIISILVYICLFYLLYGMTQIRAGVAAAFFLIAIPDLYNKNRIKYFMKITAAFLFHYSAFFLYFMYFIKPNKINKYIYFTIPILGIIIGINHSAVIHLLAQIANHLPNILAYKLLLGIENLQLYHKATNIFGIYATIKLIIYYFFLFNIKSMKHKIAITLLKIYGFSIFIFYVLSAIPVLAFRLSDMLSISLILLLPEIYFMFKQKILILILLYFFMFSVFIYTFLHLIRGG